MDKCNHKWKYYKVVKNSPDFENNVTRECNRCGVKEWCRKLRLSECKKVGVFEI